MAGMRPRSREKRIGTGGTGVYRSGSGLGGGRVGGGGFFGQGGSGSGGNRNGGGRSPLGFLLLLIVLFLGGGGGLSGILNGFFTSGNPSGYESGGTGNGTAFPGAVQSGNVTASDDGIPALPFLFGSGGASAVSGGSSGWLLPESGAQAVLNTELAPGTREKLTRLRGNGRDTVTIMLYLCGTDLESRSGMASSDLSEMAAASLSEQVNILVYTGGCLRWRNNVISSEHNQIYRVRQGGLERLVENDGNRSMTDPKTLSRFIRWCEENYPADRRELILWDHGGGSASGYGYDEKRKGEGSMEIPEIREALREGGVSFDIIGFDACLMATAETALALAPYGDYLLASEETEPGTGWHYTGWLTELSKNTSMPTLSLGKKIIDDYTEVTGRKSPGQYTTLSLVDLGELSETLPSDFQSFSRKTSEILSGDGYSRVSEARNQVREFARASKIDQVDLVDLALRMGTEEGQALADTVRSAVKYNRCSRNISNAYGLSIYFPKQSLGKVDSMVRTYRSLELDESYTRCIQQYAAVSASGQALGSSYSNGGSPLALLNGEALPGFSGGAAGQASASPGGALMEQLITSLLSGSAGALEGIGLERSNTAFLREAGYDAESLAGIVSGNRLDASQLIFTVENGRTLLRLSEEQWKQVHGLALNAFYDDGEGYIDLGLDSLFEFTEDGALLGETDRTWLSINGHPVAYYHLDTVEKGDGGYCISGRVPVLLNGERAELILVFDEENPYGYVAGARAEYKEGETETVAKSMTGLEAGDRIELLCDYYSYSGEYQDSYRLGEGLTVKAEELKARQGGQAEALLPGGEGAAYAEWHPEISNTGVGDGSLKYSYRFTDSYGQQYWSSVLTG